MRISILLPVYNGSRFLPESFESILAQSFRDFELLTINDGSTDNSEEIILDYKAKDDRIVYIKNETNIGLQATLDKGLSFAKGDYIARIDSDDIWCDKDKLKKQIDFLEKNPDHALIGTAMETINEDGKVLEKIHFPQTDETIRQRLLFSSQFAHPSVMMRGRALDEIGFYSQEKKYQNVEDYELWLRIGTKYKFANLPDICLQYRIHGSSMSMQNEFRQRLAWIRLTREYATHYPHSKKALALKILSLAVPRKLLDFLIKKIPSLGILYLKFSGIKKTSH